MIACLAEHLREERTIAPLARVTNDMERQDVLEHITGQVPRRHYIGKRHQTTLIGQCQLTGSSRHVIAIELGVVFVIALANHQYDVGHSESTTIHLYLVLHSDHRLQLGRSETIGIEAEHQSVDGQIEFWPRFLRQLMLHLSDGIFRHQFVYALLVDLTLLPGIIHQQGDGNTQKEAYCGR